MPKRRAKGEGSIYRRDDGLWVGQLYMPSGKKKVKYGKTQREVRDWLHEQKEAVSKGTLVESKAVTLEAFMKQYMESAENSLRPKTIESYNYLINIHIVPELGDMKLTQLRPDHVQGFYNGKISAGLSKRTVQYMHAVLHKALDQALKWGLVARNVSDLVEVPSPPKRDPTIWELSQAKKFLEQVRPTRFYPMYTLAYVALREGEILGVHWEDFNMEKHTLTINHAIQYIPKKGLLLVEPKTKKSRRTIKLPDFVYQALCEHAEKNPEHEGLMFTTSSGTPFSPRNFLRHFKDQTAAAGLPEIRLHDLRHSCISWLIAMGVPPTVVQTIVGHSTVVLTLDVYTHSSTDQQDEAMGKIGEVFN